MKTNKPLSQVAGIAMQRRSFLQMIAAGAAVVSAPSLLTSCASPAAKSGVANAAPIGSVIPT